MYKRTKTDTVRHIADGADIPADPGNADYADYITWLADGNTPAPADPPDTKAEAQAEINNKERANMLPRVVREYLLGDFEAKALAAGLLPTLLPAYVKIKALDDQIKVLRAATK